MKKPFRGNKKKINSLLEPFEKKFVRLLLPFLAPFFETYQLTWLSLLWSILVLVFSYFARSNIYWLLVVSLVIFLQYLSDLFDGAIGRRKRTGLLKWGYYMDHLFDYLFLCALIIGYSFIVDEFTRYLFLFFLAVFGGFMINSFLDFSATNIFRTAYFKIGPTEMRLAFILNNIFLVLVGINFLVLILPYLLVFSFAVLCAVIYITQRNLWQMDMKTYKKKTSFLSKLKMLRKYRLFKMQYLTFIFFVLFVYINIYVYLTNPFNNFTIIENPFMTTVENNEIILHKNFSLHTGINIFQEIFAYYKAGTHIFADVYLGGYPARSNSVKDTITDIHTLRFDPSKPYLISGDQFSVLYPRNLGIFYHATLDPRTALNKTDWLNRERIYLQTVAYALDAFSNAHQLTTTIVPIGIHSVTPINIYAYPSDSLYGILYGLFIMQDEEYLKNLYSAESKNTYALNTKEGDRYLLYTYKDELRLLLQKYISTVYDPTTRLVRKDIHLSSARDAVIRSSSFYDNVILWKTLQLASTLGIQYYSPQYLQQLKQRIITTFWNPTEGYFQDDIKNTSYSSDWLIVLSTGFLTVNNPEEKVYFEKSVTYIINNNLDIPFGLKYQNTQTANQFGMVKFFAPFYGTDAIWSYWGTEYAKLLLLLYRNTSNKTYLTHAEQTLHAYTKNILIYKGFPEVYTSQGKFLETPFYKSIRQTGWVIDYEEAMLMLQSSKATKLLFHSQPSAL